MTGSREEYKMVRHIERSKDIQDVTMKLMGLGVSYYVTPMLDVIAYSNNRRKKQLTELGFIRM